MTDDRMNERVGARRFEGPDGEVVQISLFRSRITTRRGSGEPRVRACPNLDDALKEWGRTLAKYRATMREVPLLPEPGERTVVLKSRWEKLTLRASGYEVFEDRKPPGPSPLFAFGSHAEALEALQSRVESLVRSDYEVLSDVTSKAAVPHTKPVVPPLDLPEVKWWKNSVVVDLAEDSGRWTSLAAIVTELGSSAKAKKIDHLELRADSKRDPHSLREALAALVASPLGARLRRLDLAPRDDEGRPLGLGDVSTAWAGLPKLETLSIDCRGGDSELGKLRLPELVSLKFVTDQPRLPKALLALSAPKLRWLRVETGRLEPASIDALWKWAAALDLFLLELKGPYVPELVARIPRSKWLTRLATLELVSTSAKGKPCKWPALEGANAVLEQIENLTLRDEATSEPLVHRTTRRAR
jgi:hypothetical protein